MLENIAEKLKQCPFKNSLDFSYEQKPLHFHLETFAEKEAQLYNHIMNAYSFIYTAAHSRKE